jgi:thiopeptide-type bacteriocin biosynthesis protein
MAKRSRLGIDSSGRFVLRTPLLPRDELERWSDELEVTSATSDELEAAIAADRIRLREHLRELVARPEVHEAIFVASPSLHASIDGWLADPDGEQGKRTKRGLVRYAARMAARSTPFGLFAGGTVGAIGERTELVLAPRAEYRRYTRLHGDFLASLTDRLAASPEVRKHLPHRPNSSLCRVAGRLRYAMRLEGDSRSYTLVSVEPSEYLVATLQRAQHGAPPGALASALCEADSEISREEAEGYIDELIERQVLVSDLAPNVTGPEAVDDVIARLTPIDAAPAALAVRVLTETRARLAELDRQIGNEPAQYRAVHEALAPLPVEAKLESIVQVNMTPTGNVALARAVVDDIERAIEVLQRLTRPPSDGLAEFRREFRERYEQREVALVEVLDEESGIGFHASTVPSAEASPLLEGLPFPGGSVDGRVEWGPDLEHLASRIATNPAGLELVLDDADLDAMASDAPPRLPDAFFTINSLAITASGEPRVMVDAAVGPSGAGLLGRFCHSDPRIHQYVVDHLAAEEALQPDAVFAEIVHLTEGRLANICARPVLRQHEIVFLGHSGAPRDRQIPVTDLAVSVVDDRIVLRSIALDREVLPRLTNAHNVTNRSLGTYRFLTALQRQGTAVLQLRLGPLASLPFVPRIRYGRIVFREAHWRLVKSELAAVCEAKTAKQRIEAVRELRGTRRLPRWVCVEDSDNVLPIDLDNTLAVDSFAQLVKGRSAVVITELWPPREELAVRGPDGRYSNEVVVTFTRVAGGEKRSGSQAPVRRARSPRAHFVPGSDWLYAKLFCGRATADQVLSEAVAPIASMLPAWFFIRYGDPEWHVRFRVRGAPSMLYGEVLPKLNAAVQPMLDDGRVWKLQLDTYDREVDRYGGPIGIELAERLFCADSSAVLDMLAMLDTEGGADARWRLALRGIDQLFDDLGLDLRGKLGVVTSARDSLTAEHRVERDVMFGRKLGDRYRRERAALEALLDRSRDAEGELAPALERLAARSRANEPVAAELRAAEQRGALTMPVAELAWSYAHMHANRLLRSAHRAHELVIYDLLVRLYESRLARSKPA